MKETWSLFSSFWYTPNPRMLANWKLPLNELWLNLIHVNFRKINYLKTSSDCLSYFTLFLFILKIRHSFLNERPLFLINNEFLSLWSVVPCCTWVGVSNTSSILAFDSPFLLSRVLLGNVFKIVPCEIWMTTVLCQRGTWNIMIDFCGRLYFSMCGFLPPHCRLYWHIVNI